MRVEKDKLCVTEKERKDIEIVDKMFAQICRKYPCSACPLKVGDGATRQCMPACFYIESKRK